MSKYTTEVRFICEEAAGLDESVGYNDVNDVVTAAYPKIFDSSLPFYNEETKTRLLPKILLHYYQREIGFETVGLWKFKLNQKLREILPYYNQLYKSEDLEYNPLQNVDNFHTHDGSHVDNDTENLLVHDTKTETKDYTETRDLKGTHDKTETRDLQTVDNGSSSFDRNEDTILRHDKTTTRGNDVRQRGNDTTAQADDVIIHGDDVNTHAIDSPLDHWEMFSDTPQGGIDGVQLAGGVGQSGTLSDNAYLTNATHITENPAATHDTIERGDITTQHGTITNTFGNVTEQHGDIVETYNKAGDKADHVDLDGWEKTDNTNTHSGTVRDAGETTETGTIRNVGETIGNADRTHDKTKENTGTDTYNNHEYGKIGVMTYQEMQMKWRESFLNIDMQIIDELGNLFMKVW